MPLQQPHRPYLARLLKKNNRAIEALSLRYNQIISKAEAGTRMEDLALHNDTINVIESEIESRRRLDTHITNTRSTLASLLAKRPNPLAKVLTSGKAILT